MTLNIQIQRLAIRCLGNYIFGLVAKPTAYDQFAGGDSDESIREMAEKLEKGNIRLMAITGLEEDVGESLSDAE